VKKVLGISLVIILVAAAGVLIWFFPKIESLIPMRDPLPMLTRETIPETEPEESPFFYLDGEALQEARRRIAEQDTALLPAYRALLLEAGQKLREGSFSVMQKRKTPPSGDKHDFLTLSPYFWPNPWTSSGRPYYFWDGRINPQAENEDYDRKSLFGMLRAVEPLALAYYLGGNEDYAKHAARLLRAWYLDADTAMNPHLRFAQEVPGWKEGLSLGLIRGVEMVRTLDAARMIEGSPSWTQGDRRALKKWFRQYLNWVVSHPFGIQEYQKKNNHGTWFDAQAGALALYVGDTENAARLLERSKIVRIDRQITKDGEQPYELMRSRSFEYCILNLRGLFAAAMVGDKVGVDLWHHAGPQGQSIRVALDWLVPFLKGEAGWEHEQFKNFSFASDMIPLLRKAGRVYREQGYEGLSTHLLCDRPDDRVHLYYPPPAK